MTTPKSIQQIESARFEKWWDKLLLKDDELLYAPPLAQMTIKRYARKAWGARARKDTSK